MAETKAKKENFTPDELLVRLCEEIAYDRKAENILRLDLKEYSAVSDYFLLCTATSTPHVGALAERIRREVLEKMNIKPFRMDGTAESCWMIVDYGNVMIHIMTEEKRQEYQLETLWNDVPAVDAVKRIEAQLRKKAAELKKTAASEAKAAEKKTTAKKTAAKKTTVKKTAAAKKPAAKKTTAKKTTAKKPAAKKTAE
ncbi:MAG: ribosome silencing factor [Lentisphaeria bacterium]|nr:ribosome silencing factor [Lentisphaeria bacterium]